MHRETKDKCSNCWNWQLDGVNPISELPEGLCEETNERTNCDYYCNEYRQYNEVYDERLQR